MHWFSLAPSLVFYEAGVPVSPERIPTLGLSSASVSGRAIRSWASRQMPEIRAKPEAWKCILAAS